MVGVQEHGQNELWREEEGERKGGRHAGRQADAARHSHATRPSVCPASTKPVCDAVWGATRVNLHTTNGGFIGLVDVGVPCEGTDKIEVSTTVRLSTWLRIGTAVGNISWDLLDGSHGLLRTFWNGFGAAWCGLL